MIDQWQNQRIEALERAFANLAGGSLSTQVSQRQPTAMTTSDSPAGGLDRSQETRIAALESSVMALTNSITLLNQQIAGLNHDLEHRGNASHMINVNPNRSRSASVDDAQNARLDSIDQLVTTLNNNVTDYNKQMVDLITQYKSLQSGTGQSASNGGARKSWG